jgi:hypothetical protein
MPRSRISSRHQVEKEIRANLERTGQLWSKESPWQCSRVRASIYAWPAEQAISTEATAALLYLETQMWLAVADVADVIEGNKSRSWFGSDPHRLSPVWA